jgi:hypothetical protein
MEDSAASTNPTMPSTPLGESGQPIALRELFELGFNFTQLNPISPDFYLMIHATQIHELALNLPDEITRPIIDLARLKRTNETSGRGFMIEIARTDLRA